MQHTAYVMAPEDRPTSLNVVGEQITVLASGDQTGTFEIFFQAGPEGSGPPPHSHPWDESFYVVRGEVAFWLAGEERTAGPGTLVYVPADSLHCFTMGRGGAEMVSITASPGAAAMFTEFDREISPEAPDLGALVAIGSTHGLTVAVPAEEVTANA